MNIYPNGRPSSTPIRRVSGLLCCFFATLALPGLSQPLAVTARPPAPKPTPDTAKGPHIELLTSGARKTSLRGLSVVSDKIVWVSGSGGAVGKSLDGGQTWTWLTVPGYETRDFRDVEGFDDQTAVIMAIAEPADILKTTDGGQTWKLVYENKTKGMFLDALEFRKDNSGIVVGDPIDNRIFVAVTQNGGDTWQDSVPHPEAFAGEGCFATSGTNVRPLDKKQFCFVTGGPKSRLFIRDKAIDLPILQGTTSTGANSVAVKDARGKELIVTGGDFSKDTITEKNCYLSHDGGMTWIRPTTPPHGYRGCVEYIGKNTLICSGTSGVDISDDDGMNWQLISTTGFHACRIAKKGKAVYLAGGNGRIAKLVW